MLFCGKHDKDATFAYQIVETERTFTYDAAGKLLTATETEDNYGTCVYTFEYDLMGNRTYMEKTLNGTVVEWHRYEYNESNQLISEKLYNGKKTTSLAYTYDADGNREHAEGQVYQSYRYGVTGEITFGAPQYENEYTYNGESYNPNIQSQYLRARYYCVVTATFLTEDSYLGSLTEPLTLNRYNYCVSSYLNYTDPSGNSTENDVDRILREYPILSNQKSEQAIAVESFVNGVLGSAAKVIIDKPTAAYMPGMAMEELYGGQYRFNERAYNNYVNLTETLIEALSKDATNKTAYYAGRCTGDVVITAVGGVEFVYGLITTISGGSGSAAALATGIGIAAEPVTIAVTAEGVVTVVDGVNTIHYGITAFKKDADKGKEAKEADSKAAERSRNGALNEAKRDAGVPRSQEPYAVRKVPMTESESAGGHVIKNPKTGEIIYTKEYYYKNTNGDTVIIQDHSYGHSYNGGTDQGSHFNVRPSNNSRTGSIPGTKDHYPFKK